MPHIYLYIINFIDIIGSFTPIIIFIMVHQRDHSIIVMPMFSRNRIRFDMNGENSRKVRRIPKYKCKCYIGP